MDEEVKRCGFTMQFIHFHPIQKFVNNNNQVPLRPLSPDRLSFTLVNDIPLIIHSGMIMYYANTTQCHHLFFQL